MSTQENGFSDMHSWTEHEVPGLLLTETARELHTSIENDWDSLRRSACQTAAGRALWKHVIHDPLAELLAGDKCLRSLHEKIKKDRMSNAKEISGVLLAVRTLWFDSKIEAALNSFSGGATQVVLLGAGDPMLARAYCTSTLAMRLLLLNEVLRCRYNHAPNCLVLDIFPLTSISLEDSLNSRFHCLCSYLKHLYSNHTIRVRTNLTKFIFLPAGMDARAYRLGCLRESHVFEVDFPEVLQTKATLLQEAVGSTTDDQPLVMTAKSLSRVAADIREKDWLEKLQESGFEMKKNTVWVLEGIIYYLPHSSAMEVLKIIAGNSNIAQIVLLADFMNRQSTTLCSSLFHFYSDWPEQLLPALGFSNVTLSQIGDPDAHFGLLHDPLNLFNKLRSLPRSVQNNPDDGTPCCRLYLLQASGSPNQNIN